MSFSLVNPTGWTTGDLLTEDQINQLDQDHANAVDGSGGTYALISRLEFTGDQVYVADLQAQAFEVNNNAIVNGSLTVGGTATAANFFGVLGTLSTINSDTVINATDLNVSDDLVVTDNVTVGGNVTATGTVSGGIVTSENGRFPGFFELSAGDGWDSNHTVVVGTDPVLIYVDNSIVTAPRTWTISNTGARDGQFFVFKNDSSSDVTWNSPSASPMKVVPAGDGLITWRSGGFWRAMLVSPT